MVRSSRFPGQNSARFTPHSRVRVWRRLLSALVAAAMVLGLGVLTAPPASAQTPCADLHVTGFAVSPSQPIAGQVATVTVKILNSGTCVAQGFVSQWRQEPFAPAGPSAPVVDLAAGETATLDLNYTFPNAGNFESTIVIDTHNDVEETNEANNLQILPITVLSATVDLSVTSVTLNPVKPVRGRMSTATIVVSNSGNNAAKAFTVSWQPAWFTSPIVRQVNSLAAGASTTLSFTYTYPADGTFDSSVTVDSGGTVAETNEFNNTKNFQVVVEPPLADLTVINVDITPNNPVPGEPVTAVMTVKNIGNTAATSFRAQWQPWFFAPVLSTEVDGLAAGATTTVTFDYTFQFAAVFDGTATVDPLWAVPELNEFNNSLAVKVPIYPNAIDLTINDMYLSDRQSNATQGESATMNIVVANQGNTTSGPFLVDWNPDALYVISPSNQTLSKQVDDLGPGKTTIVSFRFSYPKAGTFSTLATVDSFNRVLETNEANNQKVVPVTVGPANIDLVVTSLTLTPAQPVRFSPTKAAITVKNSGTFPAGPFFVEWRLHAADKAFNPTAFVNGLNPGESQTVSLEGTYFDIGDITTTATVDVFNNVVEPGGGENNNVLSKGVTVVPPSATLEVSLDSMRSFADGDGGLAGTGEWNLILFAVLDPTATCSVLGQSIKGIACRTFGDDDVDDNSNVDLPDDRSITVKLTDFTPLVVATAVLEDDSPLGPQFLGFASALSPYPDFLTFGTQGFDGQQGDCNSAPKCFRANFKVVVQGTVPAALAKAKAKTSGDGPKITPAQQKVLTKFKTVLTQKSTQQKSGQKKAETSTKSGADTNVTR